MDSLFNFSLFQSTIQQLELTGTTWNGWWLSRSTHSTRALQAAPVSTQSSSTMPLGNRRKMHFEFFFKKTFSLTPPWFTSESIVKGTWCDLFGTFSESYFFVKWLQFFHSYMILLISWILIWYFVHSMFLGFFSWGFYLLGVEHYLF